MSATDKTKLDNTTGGLLVGYQVSREGSVNKRYGSKSSTKLIEKLGEGKYRVPHNIGHEDYIVIVTGVGTADSATRGIYNGVVMTQGAIAVDIMITDSTNGVPINGTFNIVFMGSI